MGRDNLLFTSSDLRVVLQKHKQELIDEINKLPPTYLLNASTTDVQAEFEDKYRIDVPVLHEDQIATDTNDSYEIQYRADGTSYREMGTKYKFFIPFEGEAVFFGCRPSQYQLSGVQAEVNSNELVFTYFRAFRGFTGRDDREAEEIRRQFDNDLNQVRFHVEAISKDISEYIAGLTGTITQQIEFRKEKFRKDQKVSGSLGFPVRKRDNPSQTFSIKAKKRPIHTTPKASTSSQDTDQVLLIDDYDQILSEISNMMLVLERSPKAFANMNEEALRFLILIPLNNLYEGQVSGETFNYDGKTDILIRHKNQNVFIAECKIWDGQQVLTKTIDQLLGYVTWRDTKTAIILFNRRKNFSDVLEKIPITVAGHPNFKRIVRESDTQFRYIFTHKDDSNREFVLTIMAFDVPS